ncbi:MAG TPA: DUF1801 domain-containing protein [Cyclobacteriaceae bacterium]
MAEPKTKKTSASVEKFLDTVEDESRRDDCYAVIEIMKAITKHEPTMWGSSIVGFGSYTYHYAGGKEADWPLAAFSPRKQNLTIYIMPGCENYPDLMKKLGKFKTSKACLYVKKLDDIHIPTLKQLIKASIREFKKLMADKKATKK